MPEQGSRRGVAITTAPFTQPFETQIIRFGVKGLNLTTDPLLLEPDDLTRMTNVRHQGDGRLTGRPGLTSLATAGTSHHSVRRLNDPDTGTYTRIWGIDTNLYAGMSGALGAPIDTGYSGDPLTLVPYRPPQSGETWMFVADRSRMRKVRTDGLDLPIGLPPPGAAPTVTPVAPEITMIAAFDDSDGTEAATWTGAAGYDFSDPPIATAVPVTVGGQWVDFLTVPGVPVENAAKGYWCLWTRPFTLDLSMAGTLPATDDDLIHVKLKFSHPDVTAEFRIYFVCSTPFYAGSLPGTGNGNDDFYLKTWRTSDLSQYIQSHSPQIDAAEISRIHAIRDRDSDDRRIHDRRTSWENLRANIDPKRYQSIQAGSGRQQWLEYGVLGVPLRRGDFQRVGTTAGRDWSTITGIVIYIQTIEGCDGEVAVGVEDLWLEGGRDPDSSEPGAQQYDYRVTHYDPRTGAESNPSPEQDPAAFVDLIRQAATVTPAAFGDAAMRQRIYRRGGSLIADWYFLGENTADGGAFTDTFSDSAIVSAGTLELDNDAAITSIDANGTAVYGQPCPVLFGPVEDLLFALGDPGRPGDVYYCKPGQPDAWPASNRTEVCPPSEELVTGGVYGGQAFCFSRERLYWLYPSLTAEASTVTATPTSCKKGPISRWAMTVGQGAIWFVAEDGVYRTTGGAPDLLSDAIRPLFDGTSTVYVPIDRTQLSGLRLEFHDHDLWFTYRTTSGTSQTLIYSTLYQYWRLYSFTPEIRHVYSDEGDVLNTVIAGSASGASFTHAGLSDNGSPIAAVMRTAFANFGRPREYKLLGDTFLECHTHGVTVSAVVRLNEDSVVDPTMTVTGSARERYILEPFGIIPQRAQTISLELTWSTATAPPECYQYGVSIIPEPDVTKNRVTQWEDLGHPDEVYLTGVTLEVDTGDVERQFYVEYDVAGGATGISGEGTWATLGPFSVTSDHRHKFKFSWPVVRANLVRIRPIGYCLAWILYRVDWIFDPEPPRIAHWDINHENPWDVYVTGFDLECNTFNAAKTVECYCDQTLIQTYQVQANGRRVVHLTIQPPIRGHVLRFVATDDHVGLLYSHRWHYDAEPSEQTNWNQNYTVAGALSDKYLKALVFECDTFGQQKQVEVQVDGVTVETLVVTATGRSVVELAFPQHLGRVFRVLPVDGFPGRLYSLQWVFDHEPLALTRWETQELDHDQRGWLVPLYGQITLKAAKPVTLTLTTYNQTGGSDIKRYTIPHTSGVKQKRFVPFEATKGVLFKYLFTSSQAFWLYREETSIVIRPWGADRSLEVRPFGNDDLDRTRGMTIAALAAAKSGGGTG